jgi:hypothetical protein
LLDKPIKGSNAILGFAAAKDSGVVEVQGGDIRSRHRSGSTRVPHAWVCVAGELRRMFAAAGLDAGFFIGGDDEFIVLSMRRLATRGHTSPAHDRLW